MQRLRRAGPAGAGAIVAGAAVLYFVLFACAPALHMRAATPMADDQRREFGVAVGAGAALLNHSDTRDWAATGSLQLWFYRQFRRWFDLGAVVSGGGGAIVEPARREAFGAASGGLALRFRICEAAWARCGIDLEAGWLWSTLSLPVAVRLHPRVWLYGAPGIQASYPGADSVASVPLPLGVSVEASRSLALLVEVRPAVPLLPQVTVQVSGGLGVRFRF